MKRNFYIIICVLFIKNVYAMHCPLPTELEHQPGHPWMLSAAYMNQGWNISSDSTAQSSPLTHIPDNQQLYVQLYPQNPSAIKATCSYHVSHSQDNFGWIWVTHSVAFDPATVSVPPYKQNTTRPLGFRCDIVAANARSCSWGK